MNESVVDVHRKHLESHPFVEKYDSGYEYLHRELGFSEEEIPDGYNDVGIKQMYRIHTDSPCQFMIIQKNPNFKKKWMSEGVHGPHTHLSEWEGDTVQRNVEHSRTTVSSYLNDSRLEILIQTLISEFGTEQFGLDSSIEEYWLDNYLRTDIGDEYNNSAESPTIGADEGFFGDFAYSNVMKFQGPTDRVSRQPADDEWLKDEIAVVNPEVVFPLGVPARKALQRIGFEQTDYSGPVNRDEGKVFAHDGSDERIQGTSAISMYHLGSRESHNKLRKALNGAVPATNIRLEN